MAEQGDKLEGRVALVTGAASGIGAATARLLADHGAIVYCADQNPEGAQALACRLDVTSETDWEAVYARSVTGLDLVIDGGYVL